MTGAAEPLVGRESELAALRGQLWKARSGAVKFVLITGEAGIGKTRLAKDFAGLAHAEGAAVLFGRCDEDPLTPYQPFIEALRGLATGPPREGVGVSPGPGSDLLLRLVPELRPYLVEAPGAWQVEPGTERYWLFEAVAGLLAVLGRDHPVVLVVEDLHWADKPTLLLLRHLTRSVTPSKLLLVSTCRDREVVTGGPVADTIADLQEDGAVHRVTLSGLSDDETLALVAHVTRDPAQAVVLAAGLRLATKGNPFFLHQILRHLVETGALAEAAAGVELPVPAEVKEVIGRRLARLGDEAGRVLTAAAAIGEEFDLELLERVGDVTGDRLVTVVDELLAAGVIAEAPSATDRYRFCHALVREVLYGRLSTSRRRLLHRRVASALEALHEADPAALGQLARHFCLCASSEDADRAIDYAIRAGERAMTQLAYEEAAEHYQRALAALDLTGRVACAARCDLLLALGHAQFVMGEVPRSIGVLTEAADLAGSLADPRRLAEAVLHMDWGAGPRDGVLVRMAQEALEALDDGDPGLRAQLLSRLGMGLVNLDDVPGARAVAAQAVGAARAAVDDEVLLEALILQYYSLEGWASIEARLALSSEIITVARQAGSALGVIRALRCWMADLLQQGDIEGVDAQIEALASMDAGWRVPRGGWLLVSARATRAFLAGRFDDADRLATAALRILPQWEPARSAFGLQLLLLRREQGRASEAEPLARNLVEEYPHFALCRSMLVLALCDLDRHAEARKEFGQLAADFADVPQDLAFLFTVAALAEACAALGDRGRAERLYELLLPFADRNVALSTDATAGSASRYLGLLAGTLGRLEEADAHFRRALELNAAMGARPWIAHTQYDYARMLTDRGQPRDADRAAALLREAHATASELGMALLAKRAEMLLGDAPAGPASSPPHPASVPAGSDREAVRSATEVGRATFRLEGEYWTIAYGREVVRLKDAKGLHYLCHLLSHPGREVHVIDLVASVQPVRSSVPSPTAGRGRKGGLLVEGGREELLDAHARTAYRRRLRDLGEELEEAERFHDLERVARAKREMDFLTDELARGLGLGGRARRASSSSERARASVTQCIKGMLRKIAVAAPTLGRHLAIHVRTGTYCSYSPDPHHPITWRS